MTSILILYLVRLLKINLNLFLIKSIVTSLYKYLKEKDIPFCGDDINSFLIRFDKDQDSKISFVEFCNAVLHCEKKKFQDKTYLSHTISSFKKVEKKSKKAFSSGKKRNDFRSNKKFKEIYDNN